MPVMRSTLIAILCLSAVQAVAQSRCDCFDRLCNLSRYYGQRRDGAMQLAALKDAISFLEPQQAADYFLSWLSFGVTEARLTTAGFGDTRPMMPNNTPEGKAENRRGRVCEVVDNYCG